jgi:hypothetical protein
MFQPPLVCPSSGLHQGRGDATHKEGIRSLCGLIQSCDRKLSCGQREVRRAPLSRPRGAQRLGILPLWRNCAFSKRDRGETNLRPDGTSAYFIAARNEQVAFCRVYKLVAIRAKVCKRDAQLDPVTYTRPHPSGIVLGAPVPPQILSFHPPFCPA